MSRSTLLKSIAGTIADYRAGEIDTPTPEHVETWIEQFDEGVQEPMLEELDHVLKRTYLSKDAVEEFLSNLVRNEKLAGDDPCEFWPKVKFLAIQGGGNSQREMLQMLASLLQAECDLQIADCGGDPAAYLYLDDGVFTGNRIRNDMISWIRSDAPQNAKIHIVTISLHRGGQYYAQNGIESAAQSSGKEISLLWWRCIDIEDRKTYIYTSDVLRPTRLPDDELTQAYVQDFRYLPFSGNRGMSGTTNSSRQKQAVTC